MKEIIIPKEKAVFWMDADGFWHNEHGRFEHPKIIRHFHKSIQKDENGYYLCQERDRIREKVYFPYEETALFVFQVILEDPAQLLLNNGQIISLNPNSLYIKNDFLYVEDKNHCIKFSQKTLKLLSSLMDEDEDGSLILCLGENRYPISERS